jgi:DNA (cytosine-5)-methyltransferase 1
LEEYRPEYFVFENVTGLLSAKDKTGNLHLDNMKAVFDQAGYHVEEKTLSSADYGVLQNRKRVILVGRPKERQFRYPEPSKWTPEKVRVREIFSDLPSLQSGKGSAGPCRMKNIKKTIFMMLVSGMMFFRLPDTRPVPIKNRILKYTVLRLNFGIKKESGLTIICCRNG